MNIQDRILRRIVDSVGLERLGYEAKAEGPDYLSSFFSGEVGHNNHGNLLQPASSSRQQKAEWLARHSTWIASDLDLIGKQMFQPGIRVLERVGETKDPIENHPFEVLFHNPNPHMSRSYVMKYTSHWFQLRGNAYWMLVPNQLGELQEIWPLPANKIIPIPDAQNYVRGYMYRSGSYDDEPILLPPEAVCHFREPNTNDYHTGLSRLIPTLDVLDIDDKMRKWNNDTFDKEAVLRTLFSLPSTLQPRVYEQVKEELLHELTTMNRRYMVARGGDIDVKQIGLTQKEMEYLSGRRFNRDEIDRAFGVPEGLWAANATEASAKVAYEMFVNLTIWPILVMYAEDITTQVLRPWYGEDLVAMFDDIRPTNKELELMEKELSYQTKTINEIRLNDGLPAWESGYGNLPYPLREHEESIPLALPSLPATQTEQLVGRVTADERTEANVTGEIEAFDFKAVTDDWTRFRSISRRQMRRDGKATYNFGSEVIDIEDLGIMKHVLSFASSEDEVMKLFREREHITSFAKALTPDQYPEDIAGEISGFLGQMNALTAAAIDGRISDAEFKNQMEGLVGSTFTGFFTSTSGGTETSPELEQALAQASQSIGSYSDDIYGGRYEDSASKAETRNTLWALVGIGLWNAGKMYNDENAVLTWRRGGTEDPCGDCLTLNGQQKTAAEWRDSGWRPQGSMLECGGWNCLCSVS